MWFPFNRACVPGSASLWRVCACLLIFLPPCAGALAGNWSVSPTLEVSEIYSDNIALDPDGEEDDEFVTEINPRLSIKGDSPRVKLDADYRMQNLIFAGNSSRNNTFHQLDAGGNAVVVDDFLFFDASSSLSQQVISPDAKVAFDNVSVTGNRTDVATYNLSPYVQHNFGTAATAEVRYGYSRVTYDNDPADSKANQYTIKLRSGPSFQRVTWALGYRNEEVFYDSGNDISFKSLDGQLGVLVTRTITLEGTAGYEDNEFISIKGDTDGTLWSVGLNWAPGPRTSLSTSYGERFFGDHFTGRFQHRTRFIQWDASYREETASIRDLQLTSQVIGVIDPSGQVALVNVTFPTLTTDTFIRKRYQLGMTREHKQLDMRLQVFDEQREFQSSGDEEEIYGGDFSLGWQFASRTSTGITGSWQRRDFHASDRQDDLWFVALRASRQISQRISGTLEYRRAARESNESLEGYDENRVSARVNIQF